MEAMREMDAMNRELQEKAQEQRDRHFQLLQEQDARSWGEEVAARQREAVAREKEAAATAAFNQGFLSVFGQLVQAIGGRRAMASPALD